MGTLMPVCDRLAAESGALFAVLCVALAAFALAVIASGFVALREQPRAGRGARAQRDRYVQGIADAGLPGIWRLYRQLGLSRGHPS